MRQAGPWVRSGCLRRGWRKRADAYSTSPFLLLPLPWTLTFQGPCERATSKGSHSTVTDNLFLLMNNKTLCDDIQCEGIRHSFISSLLLQFSQIQHLKSFKLHTAQRIVQCRLFGNHDCDVTIGICVFWLKSEKEQEGRRSHMQSHAQNRNFFSFF